MNKFPFLTLLGLLVQTVACGDDVTRNQRTVYVDAEGNPMGTSDDVTADGDLKNDPNSGGQDNDDATADAPINPPGTTLEGAIVSISALGVIQGWAVDKESIMESMQVRFFIGSDRETGTDVGVVTANLPGFDNNNDGNHRFEFEIPTEYRDGVEKMLRAYIESIDQQGPISPSPNRFTAYAPSAAGQAYYSNTVRPALVNNCQGCHPGEVNYDNHFRLLLDRSPAAGGTATQNRLIQKAAGQLNHGGNNRCGNINNGPCGLLQEWWRQEFGG